MNALALALRPRVGVTYGSPVPLWERGNTKSREEMICDRAEAEQRASSLPVTRLELVRSELDPTEQLEKATSAFFAIPEFRALPANAEHVFSATKEWEGSIQSVGISHFVASLYEIRPTINQSTDVADIPIGDVPAADRVLLCEGAIFRYLVGYAKDKKGTVTRKRLVYIRRGRSRPQPNQEALWLETAAMFRDDR